jgi:uncharacterized SAM-binding protein YcdF (DUF218 family)
VFYAFKQLIGALSSPLVMALVIGLIGSILHLLHRRRVAAWLYISAALIVYAGSTNLLARALIRPLENSWPALDPRTPLPDVDHIVVLGADYAPDASLPPTATIGRDGMPRVAEGLRLARLLPQARLILSGGGLRPERSPAHGYALLARDFGMPESALVVMDRAIDTSGEARDVTALLGARPFLLVTSASHMPRAMRLMGQAGARPIAAPTAHITRGDDRFGWDLFVPRGTALRTTELALHEYVGLAAISIGLGTPASRR